ncbi:MAG: LuxR C-terminal-related transcriptional regulator, partial [Chloroflexota bacterium]
PAMPDPLLLLQQSPSYGVRRPLSALRARIWLRQGRLAEALRWASTAASAVEDRPTYPREFELMTLARVKSAAYAATKEDLALRDAKAILTPLLQQAESAGRLGSVIELSIVLALALAASGDMQQATLKVQRALALAEPAAYTRIFADEGASIRPLLVAALAQGAEPAYVTRLIGTIDRQLGQDEALETDPNQLLIEPLSNRELEVLRKLAAGQTNQAIADELFIALSTVKKHVNSIYGKLSVKSRTQAINRARELTLI